MRGGSQVIQLDKGRAENQPQASISHLGCSPQDQSAKNHPGGCQPTQTRQKHSELGPEIHDLIQI